MGLMLFTLTKKSKFISYLVWDWNSIECTWRFMPMNRILKRNPMHGELLRNGILLNGHCLASLLPKSEKK